MIGMRPWPGRRTFALLAILAAAFAAWISAIPFDFRPVALPDIPARVAGIGRAFPAHVSRSDLLSNATVFLVIGFLAAGALGLDRFRFRDRVLAMAATVLAGGALSATIEFAQVFLPDRTSSLVDVGAQVGGVLLGTLGWTLTGQQLVEWVREGVVTRERPSAVLRLLLVYTFGFILYRLYPFDFTVGVSDLASKFRSGQIALVPFQSLPAFPAGLAHLVARSVTAVPIGALAALLGVPSGTRRPVLHAVAYATLILAVLEGLKALEFSHYADPGNVLLGLLGALVGALVAIRAGDRRAQADVNRREANWLWWAVLGWMAVVALYWWYPLDFEATPAVVKNGLERLSLVPFAAYYRTTPERVLADVPGKLLLAAPFGLFLALAVRKQWPGMPRRLQLGFVVTGAVVLWGTLEAGQIFLPSRIPDVTDVVVPAAAAWLAGWFVITFCSGARHDAQS